MKPLPIKKLDSALIDRIAAGEVIERPASVIKELLDNSIDAGSTQIDIVLDDGGKQRIVVSDNGAGIEASQMELALTRHATSKITNLQDLFQLHTLGFRGEALASIASVARLNLKSRPKDSKEGSLLLADGGRIIDQSVFEMDCGTTVEIFNLFESIPARLKFLKSKETELSHIQDMVIKTALANPQIGFSLHHQNRKILQVLQTEGLLERIEQVFGAEIKKAIYSFENINGSLKVNGFIGHPQLSRSHSKNIYLFVNQRPVKDRTLIHAVMQGYRNLLMKGRYPFVVLFLDVPHTMVDMNVHPQKTEVRFSQSQVIHRLVVDSIQQKLAEAPWVKTDFEKEGPQDNSDNQAQASDWRDHFRKDTLANKKQSLTESKPNNFFNGNQQERSASLKNSSMPDFKQHQHQRHYPKNQASDNDAYLWLKNRTAKKDPSLNLSKPQNAFFDSIASGLPANQPTQPRLDQLISEQAFDQLSVIGQLFLTYILCEAGGKLFLIDQHAADERVWFEKLKKKTQEEIWPSEQLLIPPVVDLNSLEVEKISHYQEKLKPYGIQIQKKSQNQVQVKSWPTLFKTKVSPQSFIKDLVMNDEADWLKKGVDDKLDPLLATMACHRAIRANQKLSIEQMQSLVKQLTEHQFTHFCPHGRPTILQVDQNQIEKWFQRIV